MNKVTITINSRQYTVVAEESEEYIKSLGEHINDKVTSVLRSGSNIMGERPVVLAALNICDEYFKVNADKAETDKILGQYSSRVDELEKDNEELKKKASHAQKTSKKTNQISLDENQIKTKDLEDKLNEAELKIKFLEGQIRLAETRQKEMKQEFAAREQEMLDIIEKK